MQWKHERVELTCRSIFAVLLIAIFVLLPSSDRVCAQGLPMVPDPIDSRDLMDYADRLTLSRQQKLAILPMHDAYFKRFARLRERDIQKIQDDLMELIASINPMALAIPPREDIEALVRQYDLILKKIQTVDRRLFNDIRTILTDEQMLLVDLVRRARERSLYRQVTLEVGGEFNPGAAIDLSEMVRDLDLTTSVKVMVDPMMRTYESALLEGVRDLHREMKKIVTMVLDTIDDLGLRDMSFMEMGERFNDEEFQASIMALFDEASRPFQKATSDISRLNLTTYQRLAKLLDPESRRKLRGRYFQKVYSRSVRGLRRTEEYFRRVLKIDGLTASQRDEIKQLQETFHMRNKPVILEIAGLIEDSRRYRTMMQLEDKGNNPQEKKIQNLVERREQITKTTKRTIDAILGPKLVAQLEDMPTDEQLKQESSKRINGGDGGQRIEVAEGMVTAYKKVAPSEFLPISLRGVEEYAVTLKLDASQRSILDSLYDDYRLSFDALSASPKPADAPAPPNPGANQAAAEEEPDENRVALEKAKSRIETFISIQDLDATFIANLGLVLEGDQSEVAIERFHLKRRREISLNSLSRPSRFNSDFNETLIDLTHLLDDISLSDIDRRTTEAPLQEYEQKSVVMLELLSEVIMELERMYALRDVIKRERPTAAKALEPRMQKSYDALRETNKTLMTINRTHLAKLQEKLSEDARWRFARRYNEQAYPEIYRDDRSAEKLIDSALQLDDLTSPQREGILHLAAAFRDRYYGLSQEMVDIVRQRPDQVFNGAIPIDMILRELHNEKLKYERNETSERTRTRIELLLSEEQMMLAKRSIRDG